MSINFREGQARFSPLKVHLMGRKIGKLDNINDVKFTIKSKTAGNRGIYHFRVGSFQS
jgi:hypothetical protein